MTVAQYGSERCIEMITRAGTRQVRGLLRLRGISVQFRTRLGSWNPPSETVERVPLGECSLDRERTRPRILTTMAGTIYDPLTGVSMSCPPNIQKVVKLTGRQTMGIEPNRMV